jgi:hypothetical protein
MRRPACVPKALPLALRFNGQAGNAGDKFQKSPNLFLEFVFPDVFQAGLRAYLPCFTFWRGAPGYPAQLIVLFEHKDYLSKKIY